MPGRSVKSTTKAHATEASLSLTSHDRKGIQQRRSSRLKSNTVHSVPILSSRRKNKVSPQSNPARNQGTASTRGHRQIHSNSILNHVKPDQVSITDPLLLLWTQIKGVGAMHNSEARFPQPKCLPGTREKILQELRTWAEDSHTIPGVYWLRGSAGIGKSAIAQTISEEFEKTGRLAASFFFSRHQPKRNLSNYLFPAIAYQLTSSVPELREPIANVIRSDPDVLQHSLELQFARLIAEPCRGLVGDIEDRGPLPSLVVIDGLDECIDNDGQHQILTTLGNALSGPSGPRLRYLILSRPEPSIKDTLDLAIFRPYLSCLSLDSDASSRRDIQTYLCEEFERIHADSRFKHIELPNPWPSSDDIAKLVTMSSGQFIYAACVINYLNQDFSHPLKQLNTVLGRTPRSRDTSPFAALDALYKDILSANSSRSKLVDILSVLVSTTFNSYSVVDVETLMGLQEGEVTAMLSAMHSVLSIPDHNNPRISEIQTFHTSFVEFLHDQSRSGEFYIDQVHQKSLPVSCAISWLNSQLPALQECPNKLCEPNPSTARILSRLWDDWPSFCRDIRQPTDQLVKSLQSFDIAGTFDIVVRGTLQDLENKYWVEKWLDLRCAYFETVQWLEGLELADPSLIMRFRKALEGLHVSIPDDQTWALESLAKLPVILCVPRKEPKFGCLLSSDFPENLGRVDVRVANVEGCAGHSSHSLQCAPGTYYLSTANVFAYSVPIFAGLIQSHTDPPNGPTMDLTTSGSTAEHLQLVQIAVDQILEHRDDSTDLDGYKRKVQILFRLFQCFVGVYELQTLPLFRRLQAKVTRIESGRS
ncbi:hypothetical protein L218DRAFT_962835 [Marasmius fiardii PR-910]|nr:hypothetical protein L218DRAFT_962835 [Marasmius fiardii PR-910]